MRTSVMDFSNEKVKERLFILSNDTSCAIFHIPAYTSNNDSLVHQLHSILSPCGYYCYIYYNGFEYKHLTKFVPSKFLQFVIRLLDFRNRHARHHNIYWCDRFCSSEHSRNDDDWSICRFRRRLYTTLEISYLDLLLLNNCLEHDSYLIGKNINTPRDKEKTDVVSINNYKITKAYPLQRIPKITLHAFNQWRECSGGVISQKGNFFNMDYRYNTHECSAASIEAIISELKPQLSALGADPYLSQLDQSLHLSVSNSDIIIEYIDGVEYVVVGGHCTQHSAYQHFTEASSAVLAYFSKARPILENSSSYNQRCSNDRSEAMVDGELAVEAWIPSNEDHQEVLIRLKGEMFTFYHCKKEKKPSKDENYFCCEIHISYLQSILENEMHLFDRLVSKHTITFNPYELAGTRSGDNNSSSLLRCYSREAYYLFMFRERVVSYGRRWHEKLSTDIFLAGYKSNSDEAEKLNYVSFLSNSRSSESKEEILCNQIGRFVSLRGYPPGLKMDTHCSIPQLVVRRIRAMFHDRTMIDYDPYSQCFKALLANGRELHFTLSCFTNQEGIFLPKSDSDTNLFCGNGANDQLRAWVPHLKVCIAHLLRFHKWAQMDPAERSDYDISEKRLKSVARAAALQSQRHQLIKLISSGLLSSDEAYCRSCLLQSHLENNSVHYSPLHRLDNTSHQRRYKDDTPSTVGENIDSGSRPSAVKADPSALIKEAVCRKAGLYIYQNLSINCNDHLFASEGAGTIKTKEVHLGSVQENMNLIRDSLEGTQPIHTQNSVPKSTLYSTAICTGTAHYLTSTFVKAAQDSSKQAFQRNSQFLATLHIRTIMATMIRPLGGKLQLVTCLTTISFGGTIYIMLFFTSILKKRRVSRD